MSDQRQVNEADLDWLAERDQPLTDAIREAAQSQKICHQCEANARWNEAGGYVDLAEECREYCRNGHRTEAEMEAPAGAAQPGDDKP